MYSLSFRRHILSVGQKEGLSVRKLAKRFNVSFNSITKWKKNLSPCLKRNKPPTKLENERLLKDVQQFPDSYQHERANRLGVSASCVHFALKRLKITYKKNAESPQSGSRKKVYILPEHIEI